MNEFLQALEQLRHLRRWTQEEMAKAIGVSRTGYNDIIKGRRNLTLEHMQNAAEATNTSLLVAFLDNKELHQKEKGKKK